MAHKVRFSHRDCSDIKELQENGVLLSFPYVCREPVLVKSSFLHTNGSKRPFFHLVGGAEVWVERARRALVVGHGGEGLQGVAEDVEARGDRDLLRHGLHVDRVDDAEGGLQSAVADAGLGTAVHRHAA